MRKKSEWDAVKSHFVNSYFFGVSRDFKSLKFGGFTHFSALHPSRGGWMSSRRKSVYICSGGCCEKKGKEDPHKNCMYRYSCVCSTFFFLDNSSTCYGHPTTLELHKFSYRKLKSLLNQQIIITYIILALSSAYGTLNT